MTKIQIEDLTNMYCAMLYIQYIDSAEIHIGVADDLTIFEARKRVKRFIWLEEEKVPSIAEQAIIYKKAAKKIIRKYKLERESLVPQPKKITRLLKIGNDASCYLPKAYRISYIIDDKKFSEFVEKHVNFGLLVYTNSELKMLEVRVTDLKCVVVFIQQYIDMLKLSKKNASTNKLKKIISNIYKLEVIRDYLMDRFIADICVILRCSEENEDIIIEWPDVKGPYEIPTYGDFDFLAITENVSHRLMIVNSDGVVLLSYKTSSYRK